MRKLLGQPNVPTARRGRKTIKIACNLFVSLEEEKKKRYLAKPLFSTQESHFPLQLFGKGIRLISLCYTRRYWATQWSRKQSAFKAASSLHLIEWLRLSGLQRTPTTLVNSTKHPPERTRVHAAPSTPVPPKRPKSTRAASATPPCAAEPGKRSLFNIRGNKSQAPTEPLNGRRGCRDASAARSKESFQSH